MGISQPRKYVLKPQREGGGNNFYDDNIRQQLEKVSNSKDRTAWILMDRIYPPVQKNYLIRADSKENDILQDVVSELGIYGVIIGYVLFLKDIISDTFICNQYLFEISVSGARRRSKLTNRWGMSCAQNCHLPMKEE